MSVWPTPHRPLLWTGCQSNMSFILVGITDLWTLQLPERSRIWPKLWQANRRVQLPGMYFGITYCWAVASLLKCIVNSVQKNLHAVCRQLKIWTNRCFVFWLAFIVSDDDLVECATFVDVINAYDLHCKVLHCLCSHIFVWRLWWLM